MSGGQKVKYSQFWQHEINVQIKWFKSGCTQSALAETSEHCASIYDKKTYISDYSKESLYDFSRKWESECYLCPFSEYSDKAIAPFAPLFLRPWVCIIKCSKLFTIDFILCISTSDYFLRFMIFYSNLNYLDLKILFEFRECLMLFFNNFIWNVGKYFHLLRKNIINWSFIINMGILILLWNHQHSLIYSTVILFFYFSLDYLSHGRSSIHHV